MVLAVGENVLLNAGSINDEPPESGIGPSPYSTYSSERISDIVSRLYKLITGSDITEEQLNQVIYG